MRDDYYISTDKALLSVDKIHDYISTVSYWGRERTLEQVETCIANSLCFGLYSDTNGQIGFARMVTDGVVFGNLMDVIIFEPYQAKGYGKKLVSHIMNHEVVKNLKTISLKTKDAHGMYEKFGFNKVGESELWMSNDRVILL